VYGKPATNERGHIKDSGLFEHAYGMNELFLRNSEPVYGSNWTLHRTGQGIKKSEFRFKLNAKPAS
jgi:hypothetical protein